MKIDTNDAAKRDDEDYESDDGGIEEKIKEVSALIKRLTAFYFDV